MNYQDLFSQQPWHSEIQYAGQQFDWSPQGLDTLDNFKKHQRQKENRKHLEANGWLTHPGFKYRYNNFGFRGDDFTEAGLPMAFGASDVFGIGLPEDQIWISRFSEISGQKIYNLGVPGGSCDTVYRLMTYWVDRILPKFVLVFWPPIFRYEVSKDNHTWEQMNIHTCVDDYNKNYFSNFINSSVNSEKNLVAVCAICDRYNIPLYKLSSDHDMLYDHGARDTYHPSKQAHEDLAKKFFELYQQKKFINLQNTTKISKEPS